MEMGFDPDLLQSRRPRPPTAEGVFVPFPTSDAQAGQGTARSQKDTEASPVAAKAEAGRRYELLPSDQAVDATT